MGAGPDVLKLSSPDHTGSWAGQQRRGGAETNPAGTGRGQGCAEKAKTGRTGMNVNSPLLRSQAGRAWQEGGWGGGHMIINSAS